MTENQEKREPMTLEKFIEGINIEDGGFYPFSMFEINDSDELTVCALALPDCQHVYSAVRNILAANNSKQIFLAVDFPANQYVETDFVGVFYFGENDVEWSGVLLPYDKDSNRLPLITSGAMLDVLIKQTNLCCPLNRNKSKN